MKNEKIKLYICTHNKAQINKEREQCYKIYKKIFKNTEIINCDDHNKLNINLLCLNKFINEFVIHYIIYKNYESDYIVFGHYRYMPVIRDLIRTELDENTIYGDSYCDENNPAKYKDFIINYGFVLKSMNQKEIDSLLKNLNNIPHFKDIKDDIIMCNRESFICHKNIHKQIIQFVIKNLCKILRDSDIKNIKDFVLSSLYNQDTSDKEFIYFHRKWGYICEYLISLKIKLMTKYEGYNFQHLKYKFI